MYGAHYNHYRPVAPATYYTNTVLTPQPVQPDYTDSYESIPTYNAVWIFLDIETSGLNPQSESFGVLEIAAVITNEELIVIDHMHVIVNQSEIVLTAASKWCQQHFSSRMSGGNDLFDQCRASAITEEKAGLMLKDFILKHAAHRLRPAETNYPRRHLLRSTGFGDPLIQCMDVDTNGSVATPPKKVDVDAPKQRVPPPPQQETYRVMLAGCSVYFDRHVLLTRFPYLSSYIGHKTIDMTSILEVARRFRPDLLSTLRAPTGSHRALIDINESLNILRWFNSAIMMK